MRSTHYTPHSALLLTSLQASRIWNNPPRFLRQVIGAWTLSGTPRLTGSYVFQSYVGDNNSLDQGGSSGAIRNNVVPGGSNLPAGFFSIPVPQGFTQMNPNSFDITTLTGYKLYRLCQTWDTRFGALNQSGEKPRLSQFSLKFFF